MYIDDGYSGTNFNRPAINRLLNDMKLGKFNTIIVKDLSRFGRNYLEVGNYIEQIFPLFNIRFIAITDNIDSFRNPKSLQNIVVPFKNIINTEYSRDLSQKIKSSLDIKKRNGEFVGSFAPYGYIKDPDNKHHFIIDTYAAEIVDKIYDMILDGMGKPSICRKLHEMKILNPTAYKRDVLKMKYGKKGEIPKEYKTVWEISVIDKIIKDEVYCGDMIQGKRKHISYKNHKSVKNNKEDWIIVRNTHEAIIDRKKFTKVQEEIAKRNKNCSKSFGKEKIYLQGI